MNDYQVLIIERGRWRLARLSAVDAAATWQDVAPEPGEAKAAAEEPDVVAGASAVAAALQEHDYGGEPILLALPASWCLSASLSTQGLERSGRRRALEFQLEEHLPLAAEDLVADFIDQPGEKALAVACELARLRPLIEALQSAGVSVGHACPAALLAAEVSGSAADAVLIEGADGQQLVELQQGRPAQWWWFADDAPALRRRLMTWADEQHAAGAAARLMRLTADEQSDDPAVQLPQRVQVNAPTQQWQDAAARRGARILDGSASPWIEFRRDSLAAPGRWEVYRHPAAALLVAAVIAFISVFTTAWYRAAEYRELADAHQDAQIALFKQALPEQRVPATGVKQRLASEYRQLAGVGGHADEALAADELRPVSALYQMWQVLDALPEDVRYRIVDLDVRPDRVRVDGQARSHGDAERLAVALRATGRYEVDAPKTQALREEGVSFVFQARRRSGDTADDGTARLQPSQADRAPSASVPTAISAREEQQR